MTERKVRNIFTRFDRIQERDRHPDVQTDGQTDTARQNTPRVCIASRGNC